MLARAIAHPPFPYEDTRTWIALRDAIHALEERGALHLACGERPILSVLCSALDHAGVFSLGDAPEPARR